MVYRNSFDQAIKAENCITLTQHTHGLQISNGLGESEIAAMFRDDQAPLRQKRSRTEEREHAIIIGTMVVGRVEENDLRRCRGACVFLRENLEGAAGVDREDTNAFFYGKRGDIFLDERHSGGMIFKEHHFGGATTQGLDADSAGAGKGVDEAGADHELAENIEECFPKAIACGAKIEAFEALQVAAAKFSSDNAHGNCCASTYPGEMIAALPLARQNAKDFAQEIVFGGIFGEAEGFLAREFQ